MRDSKKKMPRQRRPSSLLRDMRQQPKTDYTYSETQSYRARVTPERRVGSPNMSRRGLHFGSVGYHASQEYSDHSVDIGDSSSSDMWLRSRNILRKQDALDAYSDLSEEEASVTTTRNTRGRRKKSETPIKNTTSSSIIRRSTRSNRTTTINAPIGLDAESDAEGPEASLPNRAMPIVGGRTSLFSGNSNSVYSHSRRSSYNSQEAEDTGPMSTVVTWTRSFTRVVTTIVTSVLLSVVQAATSLTSKPHSKSRRNSVYDDSTNASLPNSQESTADSRDNLQSKTRVTKTLVSSVRRRVSTTSEWYKEKLHNNSLLWCWLPLAIMILLAALGASWWLLQSDHITDGEDVLQTSNKESFLLSLKLWCSGMVTASTEYIVAVTSLVVENIVHVGQSIFDVGLVVFDSVKSAIISSCIFLINSFLGFFVYVWSLLVMMGEYLYSLFTFTHDKDVSSNNKTDPIITYTEWISTYSPLPYISSITLNMYNTATVFLTTLKDSIVYCSSAIWSSWVLFISYIGSIVSSGYDACIGAFSSAWENAWTPVNKITTVISWWVMSLLHNSICAFAYIGHGISWLLMSLYELLTWTLSSLWSAVASMFTTSGDILLATPAIVGSSLSQMYKSSLEGISSMMPSMSESEPSPPKSVAVEEFGDSSIPAPPLPASSSVLNGVLIDDVVAKVLESSQYKALHENVARETEASSSFVNEIRLKMQNDLDHILAKIDSLSKSSVDNKNSQEDLYAQTESLKQQVLDLGSSLEMIQAVTEAEADKNADARESVDSIKNSIVNFDNSIAKLQIDHNMLAEEVKSCCKDKLTLSDIDQYITTMFANLNTPEEDRTNKDMRMWVNSYLAAQQINNKLSDMYAKFQGSGVDGDEKIAETKVSLDETSGLIIDMLVKKIKDEIQLQQTTLSEKINDHVIQEMTQYKDTLATNLEGQEEVSVDIEARVGASVNAAIQNMIPAALDSALPDAVQVAVDEVVGRSVSIAMNDVVSKAINITASEIKNDALKKEMDEAISKAVQKEVSTIEAAIALERAKVMSGSTDERSSDPSVNILSTTVNLTHNMSSEHRNSSNGSMHPFLNHDLMIGLDEAKVMRIVKEALLKYDADKTGMPDYALETAGGSVVSIRCTETYEGSMAEYRIFGFPFYRYSPSNPRTVIQPESNPGQCWAFVGSQGFLVIQLAGMIKPTGFTLEHIPKSLSPSGTIESAPKEFSVYGLNDVKEDGTLLGIFTYNDNGDPLQYFPVSEQVDSYFQYVELKINSNYGNIKYTCLYRFRVHGIMEH